MEKSVKAGKPVAKAAKIAGPVSDVLQTVGDAQKVKDGEMTKTHFGVNLTFTLIGNVPTIPTVIVGNGYSLVESFYGGGRGWKGLGEDLKNSLVSLQQKIVSDVKSSLPFLNKNREDEGGSE